MNAQDPTLPASQRDVEALCRTLAHGDERARVEAASALILREDKSAIPLLCEIVRLGDNVARARAMEVLIEIGDASLLPHFREALSDHDWYVRLAAVVGLSKFGDSDVAVLLRRALTDRHVAVRRAAAESLGNIGDLSSLPALRARLHPIANEADEVKDACRRAIAQIEAAAQVAQWLPRPADLTATPRNLPRPADVPSETSLDSSPPPSSRRPSGLASLLRLFRRKVSER